MIAGEQEHAATGSANPLDYAVGTDDNVGDRFAAGATVMKKFPPRSFPPNFSGGLTLVVAVVPFDEVSIEVRFSLKASQLTRAGGA
jgi:hypothetical protein